MNTSSIVELIDYKKVKANHTILELTFKTGDTYRYYDVPSDVFNDFISSDSRGSYFAKNIRTNYRYEKIQ